MIELNVLVSLVKKLLALGYMNEAEKFAADDAISRLQEKLKEEEK